MPIFRLVLFIALAVVTARAQVTAIKAGRLIDPDAGTASPNQIILIEAGRIKAVGANLPVPPNATVIDLSNMSVMPGMFDCHSHVCYSTVPRRGVAPQASRSLQISYYLGNTTAYRAIQGVVNARTMLETGFTTIRDVGNAGNYADADVRRAIQEGLVPGPTMITAGRIIAPFGGQYAQTERGYTITPERRGEEGPEYLFADTRDELKKAIRENIFYGAQLIKIVVDDQPYIYSVDDIRFIIEEAHRAGCKVAAHCVTEAGARNAAEAGVDSIEHGFVMSDGALELAVRNNVVLVGTDFTPAYLREYGQSEERIKSGYARSLDRIKRAYKIGVPMAFGSDVIFDLEGKTRGEVSLSIVDAYIEAGLPNPYILRMLTTYAARLLGVDKERGAIKAGQAADLVAMPENPLENIQAIKQVRFVMKNGNVFKQTGR